MLSHGFDPHNHAACVAKALTEAAAICSAAGVQFTKVRRRVLELLLDEHKAMGAYEILTHLNVEGLGSQPPVAYRALGFLVSHGLAHKIERLNAYVACSLPGASHIPAFMICRACRRVVEADTVLSSTGLGGAARKIGFHIETTMVEAEGICSTCKKIGAVE